MEENKKKKAVAITYDPNDNAPRIVASGVGHIADKIIDKAKESDVPLYEDNTLVNTLTKLEIGDYIPPELYGVVAEILVFVDSADKLKGKINGKH